MANPYKDRIVNEEDNKPRYRIINEATGEVVVERARMEVSSEILQEGDKFGAKEANTFISRSEDGTIITSNFMLKEDY